MAFLVEVEVGDELLVVARRLLLLHRADHDVRGDGAVTHSVGLLIMNASFTLRLLFLFLILNIKSYRRLEA